MTQIPPPTPEGDEPSGATQIASGMKQMATGAKQVFAHQVAPAVAHVTRSVQQQAAGAKASGDWRSWVPIALPVFALLGIIALLLPGYRGGTDCVFHGSKFLCLEFETASLFPLATAKLTLIALLLVAVLGVWATVAKRPGLVKTAAISGIVAFALSLVTLVDAGTRVQYVSDFGVDGAELQVGSYLLLLFSVGLLVTSILALKRRRKGPVESVAAEQRATGPGAVEVPAPESAVVVELPPLPPDADGLRLREIAAYEPTQRPAVAAHPNAYPELLSWLATLDDPQVNAALASRWKQPQ